MKELSLKEIQMAEKEMLKELIAKLDKNSIEYYMIGGTFLGAVRHKGFIPWDDDIDIGICRNEYDKLIELIKNKKIELDNGYFFEGYEIGNGRYPFLKVIDPSIRIDQKEQVDKFLWIDVFPVDNLPNDPDKALNFINDCFYRHELYSLMLMKYKNVFKGSKTLCRRIVKIFVWPIINLFNKDKYVEKYIKYCQKYNSQESDYVGNANWCLHNSGVLKKEYFKPKKYTFEGLEINGFEDYDGVLTASYGKSYMTPPPENERWTHCFKAYKDE